MSLRTRFARRFACVATVAVGVGLLPATVHAAPGVPADPTVVFQEDFEHVPSAAPVLLEDYVSASPFDATYSGDPYYLNPSYCNGIVTSWNSTANAACGGYDEWIRDFARALGHIVDPATEDDNHALSEFTTGGTPPANAVVFETNAPLALPAAGGRFVSFSVDVAAAYCGNVAASRPRYDFFLLDGATEVPVFPTPIQPCADAGGQAVSFNGRSFRVGSYPTHGGVLFAGSQLGIRLRNQVAVSGGAGNDAAIDNIRVLDATPKLDKSFAAPQVAASAPARLRLRVTNTSDLGAKAGWSFTDTLATGLKVAATPNVAVECQDGARDPTDASGVTATAPAGAGTIAVSGALKSGDVSCTVAVDVVSAGGQAASYVNGPANIGSRVGIDPPDAGTTISFQGPPAVAITGPAAGTKLTVGAQEPVDFGCSAPAGVDSCTATVTPPGGGAPTSITDGDNLPTATPGVYTITAKVVDEVGQEQTVTRTYEVFPPPTATIDGPTAGTKLTVGAQEPVDFGCAAAAGVDSCTATVTPPGGGAPTPITDGANLPTATPGVYTITAKVKDALGVERTVTRTYEVFPPPTATIDGPGAGARLPVGGPAPIDFGCAAAAGVDSCTATVTPPGGGAPVPITDGANLPTATPGVYTIAVKVKDDLGVERTVTRTYEVFPPPTATIDGPAAGTKLSVGERTTVDFGCTAAAGVDACVGTIKRPDGSTVAITDGGELPTDQPGSYELTVKVTDELGQTKTVTRTYTVSPGPKAEVVAPSTGGPIGQGGQVPAGFACADGTAPVTCEATVRKPDGTTVTVKPGDPWPTDLVGGYEITVTATDADGRKHVATSRYEVSAAVRQPTSEDDLLLECGRIPLTLIDVTRGVRSRGGRYAKTTIVGVADQRFVGQRVAIRYQGANRVVGRPLVGRDGRFRLTIADPDPRNRVNAEKRRFRAEIGGERSLALKLTRRFVTSSVTAKGGSWIVRAVASRPLLAKRQAVEVRIKDDCGGGWKAVGSAGRLTASGRFVQHLPAPKAGRFQVVRLVTVVDGEGGRRAGRTYTVPRGLRGGR
ncbi:DUF7933 domain-containing protein [Patulibacter defluvii]|uniref:DUF7933 domain-containing protein n=1 Tax=Patulibacter defluvii TaxID=3095358 RepID=UPI002A74E252|nr:hypothetical protein [Patulibacter sp. DM4]